MAVLFDAQSTADTLALSAVTVDHNNLTVGTGPNRALVVAITWGGGTIPTGISVVWDQGGTNQALALISGASSLVTNRCVQLYGVVNPTSGNKTLRVSWTNTNDVILGAVAVTGALQTGGSSTFTNGAAATGTGTTASRTVTSAVGDYVVGAQVAANTIASVNQTQLFIDNGGTTHSGSANHTVGAAASPNMSATLTSAAWGAVGANIKAAPTSVGRISRFRTGMNSGPGLRPGIQSNSRGVSFATGGSSINMDASQTLDPVTQSTQVNLPIAVSAAQTIPAVTQSTAVALPIAVSASQTIPAVTQSTAVALPIALSAAQTIDPVTQSTSVSVGGAINMTAAQTIGAVTQSTQVNLPIAVSAAQTIPAVTQSTAVTVAQAPVVVEPSRPGGGAGGRGRGGTRGKERARARVRTIWDQVADQRRQHENRKSYKSARAQAIQVAKAEGLPTAKLRSANTLTEVMAAIHTLSTEIEAQVRAAREAEIEEAKAQETAKRKKRFDNVIFNEQERMTALRDEDEDIAMAMLAAF